MTDEQFDGRIAVLKPERGDIVVLETEYHHTAQFLIDLKERVDRQLPEEVTCLVLPAGVNVAGSVVVREVGAVRKITYPPLIAAALERVAAGLESADEEMSGVLQ